MKITELLDTSKQKTGTYAAVTYDEDSAKALSDFAEENNIPDPVAPSDLHATLLYSRKHLPDYEPLGDLETPLTAKVKGFKGCPTNSGEKNCLVALLDCPELEERWKYLMDTHGATWDFPDYTPHTTLSYDVGDLDASRLNPDDLGELVINHEFSEDLEDDDE